MFSKVTRGVGADGIPLYLNEPEAFITWDVLEHRYLRDTLDLEGHWLSRPYRHERIPRLRIRSQNHLRRSGGYLQRQDQVAFLVTITLIPFALCLLAIAAYDYQRAVNRKIERLKQAAQPYTLKLAATRAREKEAERQWLAFKGPGVRLDRRTRFERRLAQEALLERGKERKAAEREATCPLWKVREMERWGKSWWVLWMTGEREPGINEAQDISTVLDVC